MIVQLANNGQMCNQMLTLIATYALGLKYQTDVCCPVMKESLKDVFAFDDSRAPIHVRMYHAWYASAVLPLLRIMTRLHLVDIHRQYDSNRKGMQCFWHWAYFKEDDAIADNRTEVCRYFAFKKEITDRCEQKMTQLKCPGKMTIGVHVRRGDYKTFQGGRFYFDDDQYAKWMASIAAGRSVRFVIFSNEKVDFATYQQTGLDLVCANGSGVEDLCCMSMCDYIMGPDSTYSWVAMVLGSAKRLVLSGDEKRYTIDDFKSFDEFVVEVNA